MVEAQCLDVPKNKRPAVRATLSLFRDLFDSEWQIETSSMNGNLEVTIQKGPILSKKQMRKLYTATRHQQLLLSADWIKSFEPMAMEYLVNGSDIRIDKIKPELELVTSKFQNNIWRYCRFIASVPFANRVGRRLRFLIRDGSLPKRPIIGIAGLGSSVLQLGCREDWIGWDKNMPRERKLEKMGGILDLYAAIAMPPYNSLLAGKLIVYTMASNEIGQIYRNRYLSYAADRKRKPDELVLVTTIGAFPKRSSIYNRISYKGNPLLINIGFTGGWGTLLLRNDTLRHMKKLLQSVDEMNKATPGHWKTGTMLTARRALHRLGFDPRYLLNHGQLLPVYVMPLAKNTREYLRGETSSIYYRDMKLADLIDYWKNRWLRRRKENTEIVERMREFRKQSIKLTNEI
jgi:hypothetical protein